MNEYIYTTAGQYYDETDECSDYLTGVNGEYLPDDYPVTICGDKYCAGHWDGNQTWMPLS